MIFSTAILRELGAQRGGLIGSYTKVSVFLITINIRWLIEEYIGCVVCEWPIDHYSYSAISHANTQLYTEVQSRVRAACRTDNSWGHWRRTEHGIPFWGRTCRRGNAVRYSNKTLVRCPCDALVELGKWTVVGLQLQQEWGTFSWAWAKISNQKSRLNHIVVVYIYV